MNTGNENLITAFAAWLESGNVLQGRADNYCTLCTQGRRMFNQDTLFEYFKNKVYNKPQKWTKW